MLFYAKLISGASVKLSNGKINVDEFLKTVINSERFDEIVDKIADKAVEKFSQLKNLGAAVTEVNLDKKYAYRVSEVTQKEPSNSELKQDDEDIEITTTQSDDFIRKIDTEAFMKKESADSSKHLSLKYNQFKESYRGPNIKELNEKQRTDRDEIAQSIETNEDQSLEEENKKYEQSLVATTAKKGEIESEIESDVKKPTLKTKPTTARSTKFNKLKKKKNVKLATPHEKDGSESSGEKDSNVVKEDKSMQASEQTVDHTSKVESDSKAFRASNKGEPDPLHTDGSSESNSLHKDDIKIDEEKHKDDIKIEEENNDTEIKTRQPTHDYFKLPTPRKDSVSIEKNEHNFKRTSRLRTENFVIPRVSEKQEELKKPKPRRIPVREEGNKLYTFERSPDYEDYHLARIRNHRKISIH